MPAISDSRSSSVPSLYHLVWPVFIEQTLELAISFSDLELVTHYLEAPHQAAMINLAYFLWGAMGLFAVIAVGALAMTARFVGAGDYTSANRVLNQSLLAGAVLALVVTMLGMLGVEQLVWAMRLDGEKAKLTIQFLRIVMPVLPAIMIVQVGIASLRGAGDMKSALVVMSIVNVVNVAISWSLVRGWGPIPQLGWIGIAIGTTTGHLVGGLITLAMLIVGRAGLKIRWSMLRPDRDLMRRILRVGLPGGLDTFSVVVCQLIFLSRINKLGDLSIAAHSVALRIESLAYMPGNAFQLAAATLAGQYLGARRPDRAARGVLHACAWGCGVIFLASLVLWFGADHLVYVILRSDQVEEANLAAPLLRIISIALVPFALMMIMSGGLRGAGDTRWPLVVSLVGFLLVRIPVTQVLALDWGWGVQGAWYGMALDMFVRCSLIVPRFLGGGWKKVEV